MPGASVSAFIPQRDPAIRFVVPPVTRPGMNAPKHFAADFGFTFVGHAPPFLQPHAAPVGLPVSRLSQPLIISVAFFSG